MADNKYSEDFFADYERKYSLDFNRNSCPTSGVRTLKRRKKKFFVRRFIAILVLFAILVGTVSVSVASCGDKEASLENAEENYIKTDTFVKEEPVLTAKADQDTVSLDGKIDSDYAVLINITDNRIVASKNSVERMYPASMTKILTLIVAVENLPDLSRRFEFSYEITDPLFKEGASMAGFSAGEKVTAKDMLYGAILPSGADATVGLAMLTAGSEEKFVQMMNQKAESLGLSTAHFSSSSGLYDEDNYCTAEDMAVILRYAMQNPVCAEVLSCYQYTTEKTTFHPDGILLTSTLFSRMYGTEPETAKITAGKTGFTSAAGNCIASYGVSDSGKEYIFVTAGASGKWPAAYDHINVYKEFAK